MGLHWKYGVVQQGAVSAPASMSIEDTYNFGGVGDVGTGNGAGYIDLRYTSTGARGELASSTNNVAHNGTFSAAIATGGTIVVCAGSAYSGTAPTSYAWTLSESGGAGTLANSLGNATPTTQDTVNNSGALPTITLGSISSGNSATFNLALTGTNSGGSTAATTFVFTVTKS